MQSASQARRYDTMRIIALSFAALVLVADLSLCAAVRAGEVTIKRDEFGTPHIYAGDTFGLFFGYGYAIAQDRLFQMEMAKRSTQGEVAAVLGPDYVDFDKQIRSNFDPAVVARQLGDLAADQRAIFDGYASGMNAWIEKVLVQPQRLLSRQFQEFDFQPERWSGYDVAMVFVGSMGNRFGDFNTELENQQLLNALIQRHGKSDGVAIFNQLNPISNPKAPTTVPVSQERDKNSALVKETAYQSLAALPDSHGAAPFSGFSNIVVVGKSKAEGANAILLNGPQFGWYTPAYTYSVGLHGAGFDLVGNTAFGYPVVMFGFNQDISWGSTWGAADVVDIYREKLNPDNVDEYLFNGKYLPMDRRIATIHVKGGETVQLEVFKTVHGMVSSRDRENSVAYSKRRAWAGREIETLLGWVDSTRAHSHQEWLREAARSAMNINWYYADRSGNIGYVLTGSYPQRHPQHDNRLPVSGVGDREWVGRRPFSSNPQVFNPASGFIANWNNRPGQEIENPDEYWYSWSEADRVELLTSALEADERFTAEGIRRLLSTASLGDPNAGYFIPFLEQAVADLPPGDGLHEAVSQLVQWNRLSLDQDRDGGYDEAATAIFRTWLPLMLKATLEDDLGEHFAWFAAAGYPTPEKPLASSINIQVGTKVVYEALLGSRSGIMQQYDFFNGEDPKLLLRKTLRTALNQLAEQHGPDSGRWRLPVAYNLFSNRNFLGIPQAGKEERSRTRIAMNRGSENNQTIFATNGVTGFEVVPPGQSGFVAPNGVKAVHYDDQLPLYDTNRYRRTWLSVSEVDAHAVSTIVLSY